MSSPSHTSLSLLAGLMRAGGEAACLHTLSMYKAGSAIQSKRAVMEEWRPPQNPLTLPSDHRLHPYGRFRIALEWSGAFDCSVQSSKAEPWRVSGTSVSSSPLLSDQVSAPCLVATLSQWCRGFWVESCSDYSVMGSAS